jgi:outer membrane protein insertion porin family
VTRDSRDNLQAPTRGGLTTFSVDVAGLGGDSKYVKLLASATYFKPIWLGSLLSGRWRSARASASARTA